VLLLAEAPRIVRKVELHASLWPDTFVADSTLVGLVKEVRRALEDNDAAQPLIRTAHRVGYGFSHPIERGDHRNDTGAVARWVVLPTRTIELVKDENLIGRHPASTVSIDAAGVSRRHARILVTEHGAQLEELASKNGPLVGETLLHGSVLLRDGDRI
jgi:DNA-binding winged helix-turn-helix (wHTH) protein